MLTVLTNVMTRQKVDQIDLSVINLFAKKVQNPNIQGLGTFEIAFEDDMGFFVSLNDESIGRNGTISKVIHNFEESVIFYLEQKFEHQSLFRTNPEAHDAYKFIWDEEQINLHTKAYKSLRGIEPPELSPYEPEEVEDSLDESFLDNGEFTTH